MDASQFLTSSRIIIVAGKGGVGKSAVSAALAVSGARGGMRTLLVTLDPPGVAPAPHDNLDHLSVSPGRALADYLASHGLGRLTRRLATSGLVELVAQTAPGIDDLLVLGKIKSLERDLHADLIVVDGPASGHAIDLLRAPGILRRAVPGGPIGQQADDVIAMLSDPARCRTMLVATPAMTPVHETIDVARELSDGLGLALAPVAVNMVDERPPAIDATRLDEHLCVAYEWADARARAQAEAVAHLDDSLPTGRFLLRRHRLSGHDLVEALADDLVAAIAATTRGGTR